jgi:hypothetical protein
MQKAVLTTATRDQLLASARYFSDLALHAYTNGEPRSILVNAAFAMEDVSKALLLSMNPPLLMEIRNGQFDSLLHLTGPRCEGAQTSRRPRPIGAKEAVGQGRTGHAAERR